MPGAERSPRRRSTALRIGDAERDFALAALREHHVAGRLDLAEFEQRAAAAMTARTEDELTPLFRDLPRLGWRLPAAPPAPAPARQPSRRQRWPWVVIATGVGAAVLAAGAALVTADQEFAEAPGAPAVQVDPAGDDTDADDDADTDDD